MGKLFEGSYKNRLLVLANVNGANVIQARQEAVLNIKIRLIHSLNHPSTSYTQPTTTIPTIRLTIYS